MGDPVRNGGAGELETSPRSIMETEYQIEICQHIRHFRLLQNREKSESCLMAVHVHARQDIQKKMQQVACRWWHQHAEFAPHQ